jgi:hypothetical protein
MDVFFAHRDLRLDGRAFMRTMTGNTQGQPRAGEAPLRQRRPKPAPCTQAARSGQPAPVTGLERFRPCP